MAPRPGTRAALSSTSTGLGHHFSSPRKARDKRKTQVHVSIPGCNHKCQQLLKQLQDLLNPMEQAKLEMAHGPAVTTDPQSDTAGELESLELVDDTEFEVSGDYDIPESSMPRPTIKKPSASAVFHNWQALIPTLVDVFLSYLTWTMGKPVSTPPSTMHHCVQACETKASVVRSCDAVNALASALKSHYIRRGFRMSGRDGKSVQDPFRRSLGRAIQWFDILQVEVERQIDDNRDLQHTDTISRHLRPAAGATLSRMVIFITDIGAQRVIAPRFMTHSILSPKLKLMLLDDESRGHAVDGKKKKAAMDSFDDTGLMALICCHDIPLFFANIDMPGEQQKYTIALIEHLFSLLPPQANVVILYDIGCVLSRSLEQYDILDSSIILCAASVGYEMRQDLGAWLKHRMRKGTEEQGSAAEEVLAHCDVPVTELQSQWTEQREARLSIRAHAPARLRKELDSVLALQVDLDASERALLAARSMIEQDSKEISPETLDILTRTKLHQQMRKSIAKHQLALMAAIRRFNRYCEQLEELYDPAYAIPLPSPLPTKLTELHGDPTLLQDVWVSPSEGEMPRWLEDAVVRDGIHALLKHDQCHEERRCLGIEADNMCQWFGAEMCAVELALRQMEDSPFFLLLQHRHEALQELMGQWPTPLASSVRYAAKASEVISLAKSLSGVALTAELRRLKPTVCPWPLEDLVDNEDDSMAFEFNYPEDDAWGTEELLLGDILEGSDANDKDGEIEDQGVILPVVMLLWKLPHHLTSGPIGDSINSIIVESNTATCVRPPADGFPWIMFDQKDVEILASNEARLNDTCLNGSAVLLYSLYFPIHRGDIALFSTHDIPCIR
ncbi:hypothetical protein EDD15DRAFT_2359638 [Pisolithus albus]|nr:hypothetical protein EDD15DRAFT_2359638 [Pisolithus albus]